MAKVAPQKPGTIVSVTFETSIHLGSTALRTIGRERSPVWSDGGIAFRWMERWIYVPFTEINNVVFE